MSHALKWNKILFVQLLLSLLVSNLASSQEALIGHVLPQWSEGFLDIHHINTGKGECTFFLLPDGTTMLVDAGATAVPKPRVADPKPNASRTPGEWISRYILHFLKGFPEKKLDYVVVSHFHSDHFGDITPDSRNSQNGNYKLTGISEVVEFIPCVKLIDRGWPEYNWPTAPDWKSAKNYIQFVRWQVKNKKLQSEQFQVGTNKQLVLNHSEKYPNFEIRNLAANGHVWTGVESIERSYFPAIEDLQEGDYPSENACSIAFRLSYGKFDYFSGGDLYSVTKKQWQDIETPVGWVTGPVEACKANHHANFDTMGESFLQALRPRAIIIQSWSAQQPDMSVLRRMLSTQTYSGPRDIFATNVMEETKIVVGSAIDKLKSQQGHVVIRVSPNGNNFMIYVLDDSQENFNIKATFGSYHCN